VNGGIPAVKRLAIVLEWAGSGSSYKHLAHTYDVSKAPVVIIVHEAKVLLCIGFVTSQHGFPRAQNSCL